MLYTGAPDARAAPGVLEALEAADVVVIAPSNPYVSIGPILAVEEIRLALERRRAPCVAVSPLIGGRAVQAARPTGCSRGSRAARRRRTSPAATRG